MRKNSTATKGQHKQPTAATGAAPASRKAEPHPLVGRGLHYKDEHGYVQNQASIVAVFPSANQPVGNLALIQYFDWIVGAPSTQRVISLADLATGYGPEAGRERWVLFQNMEEANDHYERVHVAADPKSNEGG
jgi:hypothetical protein